MAGSSFGTLFRFTSWGESHGPAIGCVVDGTPPRIPLSRSRHPGVDGKAPARPVALRHPAPGAGHGEDPVRRVRGRHHRHADRAAHRQCRPALARLFGEIKDKFRPCHADYTYFKKYGVRDYRGGGRQSARETAVRVAAGAIARKILGDGVRIRGAVIQLGTPEDRPRQVGLGRHGRQSLLVPRPPGGAGLGRLSRRRAQARQLGAARSSRSWPPASPSAWAIRSTTSSMPTSPRR